MAEDCHLVGENYKGIFYNEDEPEERYFEYGAHFRYHDLYRRLEKIRISLSKTKEDEYAKPSQVNENNLHSNLNSKSKYNKKNNHLHENRTTENIGISDEHFSKPAHNQININLNNIYINSNDNKSRNLLSNVNTLNNITNLNNPIIHSKSRNIQLPGNHSFQLQLNNALKSLHKSQDAMNTAHFNNIQTNKTIGSNNNSNNLNTLNNNNTTSKQVIEAPNKISTKIANPKSDNRNNNNSNQISSNINSYYTNVSNAKSSIKTSNINNFIQNQLSNSGYKTNKSVSKIDYKKPVNTSSSIRNTVEYSTNAPKNPTLASEERHKSKDSIGNLKNSVSNPKLNSKDVVETVKLTLSNKPQNNVILNKSSSKSGMLGFNNVRSNMSTSIGVNNKYETCEIITENDINKNVTNNLKQANNKSNSNTINTNNTELNNQSNQVKSNSRNYNSKQLTVNKTVNPNINKKLSLNPTCIASFQVDKDDKDGKSHITLNISSSKPKIISNQNNFKKIVPVKNKVVTLISNSNTKSNNAIQESVNNSKPSLKQVFQLKSVLTTHTTSNNVKKVPENNSKPKLRINPSTDMIGLDKSKVNSINKSAFYKVNPIIKPTNNTNYNCLLAVDKRQNINQSKNSRTIDSKSPSKNGSVIIIKNTNTKNEGKLNTTNNNNNLNQIMQVETKGSLKDAKSSNQITGDRNKSPFNKEKIGNLNDSNQVSNLLSNLGRDSNVKTIDSLSRNINKIKGSLINQEIKTIDSNKNNNKKLYTTKQDGDVLSIIKDNNLNSQHLIENNNEFSNKQPIIQSHTNLNTDINKSRNKLQITTKTTKQTHISSQTTGQTTFTKKVPSSVSICSSSLSKVKSESKIVNPTQLLKDRSSKIATLTLNQPLLTHQGVGSGKAGTQITIPNDVVYQQYNTEVKPVILGKFNKNIKLTVTSSMKPNHNNNNNTSSTKIENKYPLTNNHFLQSTLKKHQDSLKAHLSQ